MITKKDEYLKWLRSFIKDKAILDDIDVLQIQEGLDILFEEDSFIITLDNPKTWITSTSFKNPYNYESTKVDEESIKK